MSDNERKLPVLTQAGLVSFVDEHGRQHYSMDDGRPVCGRLKKEKNRAIPNEACLAPPMANGCCKVHGGKAGAPVRHGRYSRVLKTWKGAFERASSDRDLLDARQDIALMDVAIEQQLERAEEHDSPSWREALQDTFRQLQAAIRSGKQKNVGALITRLGDLIENGASVDQVARDLVAQVDKRANRACRVAELELKSAELVTVVELAAVFRQWLGVLEQALEPAQYFEVLPELKRVTAARRLPVGEAS